MPMRLARKRPATQENLAVNRVTKIVLAAAAAAVEVDVVAALKRSPASQIWQTIPTPTIPTPKSTTKMIRSRLRVTMIQPPVTAKSTILPRELMRKGASNADLAVVGDADVNGRMNDRSRARWSEPPNGPRATRMTTRMRTMMRSATNR